MSDGNIEQDVCEYCEKPITDCKCEACVSCGMIGVYEDGICDDCWEEEAVRTLYGDQRP